MLRYIVIPLAIVLALVAIWHPAPHPALVAAAPPVARHRPLSRKATRVVAAPAVVYVVGAVAHPGLYRLAAQSRANDAVRAAGGMKPDADAAGVNLAARVSDGDEIDVPLVGQTPFRARTTQRRARSASRGRRKTSPTAPVGLNSSDVTALAEVPGIGPTIAARIVALREREGAYQTFDELLDVAGMSPARLQHAQRFLTLR